MSMDSIPLRKRSRKPKHVYNAADVAPPQAPWKSSIYKPVKKVLPPPGTSLPCSSRVICVPCSYVLVSCSRACLPKLVLRPWFISIPETKGYLKLYAPCL